MNRIMCNYVNWKLIKICSDRIYFTKVINCHNYETASIHHVMIINGDLLTMITVTHIFVINAIYNFFLPSLGNRTRCKVTNNGNDTVSNFFKYKCLILLLTEDQKYD